MLEGKQGQLAGILAARFDNGWFEFSCSWPRTCWYIKGEGFSPNLGGAAKDISFYYEYKSWDPPSPQGCKAVTSLLNVFLFIITFKYPRLISLLEFFLL